MSHLRPAVRLGLAGSLSLFAALLGHELLAFGMGARDLIGPASAPCPEPPCMTVGLVVSGHVAKAMGAAFAFAVIGAVWTAGAARWTIAGAFWMLQYLWSLVGIASGYRTHFGTGWAWWEPFATLLWNPVTTPGLMVAGLAAFLLLDRMGRAPTVAMAD